MTALFLQQSVGGIYMKISTKGRYGVRALIDLAVNSANGHVSLVNIANRNQISVHYLEHVFSSLKRSGIVKSVKGAQGGYVLADAPEHITAEQILLALEGSCSIERETVNGDALCETVSKVMDGMLWERINEENRKILSSVTLADLVNEFTRLYETEQSMYYI